LSPELTTVLREETPAAPSALRERVALIAAAPPPPRRTFRLSRTLLWAAPAAAVGSLAVAVVVGVITSSSPPIPAGAPEGAVFEEVRQGQSTERLDRAFAPAAGRRTAVPAPSLRRAQNVQADLRVLVDDPNDLSAATQRALRTTRRLGGYVVTVNYGTPEPTEGAATLRVRIPVSRVQAAIVQFSDLGRILAQQTAITDLQQRLDELTRQIRRAKGDKARITTLRRERGQLNRRAAFATVDLGLTTHEPETKAAPPSRLERAVDDATGVLTAELAIVAYILIVASPFLLLLLAAFAGSRAYRRYADQRLLERA
jgi:Domain of unknown function (DUF4349)